MIPGVGKKGGKYLRGRSEWEPCLPHRCSWKHRVRLHREQWFFPGVQLGHSIKSSVSLYALFMFSSKFASLLKMLSLGERVWSDSGRNQSTPSSSPPFSQWHSSCQSGTFFCVSVFALLFWIALTFLVLSTPLVPKSNRNIHCSKFWNNLHHTQSTMERMLP